MATTVHTTYVGVNWRPASSPSVVRLPAVVTGHIDQTEKMRLLRIAAIVHLFARAARLLAGYVAVLAAVVVAGFLGGAVGIWASVLWGVVLLAVIATLLRNRLVKRRMT